MPPLESLSNVRQPMAAFFDKETTYASAVDEGRASSQISSDVSMDTLVRYHIIITSFFRICPDYLSMIFIFSETISFVLLIHQEVWKICCCDCEK